MTTEHPAIAARCSKGQIRAFEQIAIGNTSGHSKRTIEALAAKDLVILHELNDVKGGLVFRWIEPEVPVSVHMRWCEWCAENCDD